MRMTLNDLKRRIAASGDATGEGAPVVEVHGVDLALYLLYCREGDFMVPITKGSRALRFQSRYAALKALKNIGLRRADFVHTSAYDEMIGLDSTDSRAELRETINLDHIAVD